MSVTADIIISIRTNKRGLTGLQLRKDAGIFIT